MTASAAEQPSPFRLPDSPSIVDLVAKYFRALGDPNRLRIIELLGEGEVSVGELVARLGESQPKVSNHLACLRWCGFVKTRREHRTVYYAVADARVLDVVRLARALLADSELRVGACPTIDKAGA
jgi:DNA-binding transcriptional ArsR family regulator